MSQKRKQGLVGWSQWMVLALRVSLDPRLWSVITGLYDRLTSFFD